MISTLVSAGPRSVATLSSTSRMFSFATLDDRLGQLLQLGGDSLPLRLGPGLPGVLHEERQVAADVGGVDGVDVSRHRCSQLGP